jgi:hypothetical protein
VIVTFFPPIVIGLKVLEFVNAKVISPANVTIVLAFKLARLTVLFVGTEISCKVISVHAATAGAIWEYSVAVHGDAVTVELVNEVAEEVVLEVVVVVLVVELVVELVLELVVEVVEVVLEVVLEVVETISVTRQLHAVEILDGRKEH